MPSKKPAVPIEEQNEKTADKKKQAPPKPKPAPKECGHKNLHVDPPVVCTLDPGHSGHHSDGESGWLDLAGIPVEEIPGPKNRGKHPFETHEEPLDAPPF